VRQYSALQLYKLLSYMQLLHKSKKGTKRSSLISNHKEKGFTTLDLSWQFKNEQFLWKLLNINRNVFFNFIYKRLGISFKTSYNGDFNPNIRGGGSATTLSIMIFSIIIRKYNIQNNDTQHNEIYALRRVSFNIRVIMFRIDYGHRQIY
jgi:hypothetical protein